ncbi:unnamed protein product [Ambrosiozyma monospora]|uniref:Branchpoint-bridging protein n=1 Tax=Ambrosiozyma monospora TaxID=43982 RepID=A0A9W7DH49_AMBMO|nr:unnamed protein product [Ambrosiozyma monospora]
MTEERLGRFERIQQSKGEAQQQQPYSRWSGPPQKLVYLDVAKPIPTVITNSLTPEQIEAYVSLVRIEEITHKLNTKSYIPDDAIRSPSPPPIYDATGKRTNTRETRYRKKYLIERNNLISKALKTIPQYKAPEYYKKPTKTIEKFYLPTDEHPEINFIGMLIGPRGNTLKSMQEESGARIAIRGKGSVKEGKDRSRIAPHLNNFEEPLHCLITADTEEKIKKAVELCKGIVHKAIYAPVGQNDHKREQLKELAILNGTLRTDEDRICPLCHERGHKKYDCPNKDKIGFINSIVCAKCGNVGHLERDCRVGGPGGSGVGAGTIGPAAIDLEFENMMKDLNGETVTTTPPAIGSGGGHQAIEGAPQTANQSQGSPNVSSLPPIPTSGGYPTTSSTSQLPSQQQAYTSQSQPYSQSQSHSQELVPNKYQDYNSGSGSGGYRNRQYDNYNSGRGYNNNNNSYGNRERGGGYGNSSGYNEYDNYYNDSYYSQGTASQRKRPYDNYSTAYGSGRGGYQDYNNSGGGYQGSYGYGGTGGSPGQDYKRQKPESGGYDTHTGYGKSSSSSSSSYGYSGSTVHSKAGAGNGLYPVHTAPKPSSQSRVGGLGLKAPPGSIGKTSGTSGTSASGSGITAPPRSGGGGGGYGSGSGGSGGHGGLAAPPGLSAPPGMGSKVKNMHKPPPPPPPGSGDSGLKSGKGGANPPPPPPPPRR